MVAETALLNRGTVELKDRQNRWHPGLQRQVVPNSVLRIRDSTPKYRRKIFG